MSISAEAKRFGLAVSVLLLLPVGLLAGLLLASTAVDSNPTAAAVVVPATEMPYDDRRGVQLTPTWSDGQSLYAPPWAGIVGSVTDADELQSGDRFAIIDGIARVAVATPQPFFRSLELGDGGHDVAWLHDILVTLGELDSAPARQLVTEETLEAVAAFGAELGVPDPVSSFDPAWIVWLPRDPFPVLSMSVQAGQPAPGAGTVIATSPPTLTGLAIQALDGGVLDISAGDAYVLSVGDVEVALKPDGTLDDPALTELSTVIPLSDESVQGTVQRAEPRLVWSVPTAAISTGAAEGLCVWIADADSYSPMPVTVISSQAGVSYLDPGPAAVDLLTNPADVLDDPSCPSD